MGIYTAYNLPAVDQTIDEHMQLLTELCLANLDDNLDSLVLAGSFGRGEGSVLINADGTVEPLRDYDVRVVLLRPPAPGVLARIRDTFMQRTGLGNADELFSGECGFSLTIEPLLRDELETCFARDRDLRVYDHAYASRLLYGTDRATPLQFPAHEIPLVSGLRLLYQKMIGLVGHYDGRIPPYDLRRTLGYECDKTFVEICTALVLLAGKYIPSYSRRAALFNQHWQAWFPELAAELPGLGSDVVRATQAKLYPGTATALQPAESFARARAALLAVHRYYIRRLFGIEVSPGAHGCDLLRTALLRGYYQPAAARWLAARQLNYGLARWLVNLAYQRLLRLQYARGAGSTPVAALCEALWAAEAPPISVFLAAWCTLAATADSAAESLLRDAQHMLRRLPGGCAVASASTYAGYAATRACVIRAYSQWEQGR